MGYYSWYRLIGKYFYRSNKNFDERCVSKLSENNIIVEIGSTEFKLWQLINWGELQLILIWGCVCVCEVCGCGCVYV